MRGENYFSFSPFAAVIGSAGLGRYTSEGVLMRFVLCAALTVWVVASAAVPASADGPLAPGKAAGIQTASNTQLGKLGVITAAGLAALGLYFIVGTHYHVSNKDNKTASALAPAGGSQSASGTH
jgi:hypothetical protein